MQFRCTLPFVSAMWEERSNGLVDALDCERRSVPIIAACLLVRLDKLCRSCEKPPLVAKLIIVMKIIL